MLRSSILRIVLSTILLFSVEAVAQSTAEEYRVYDAALREMFAGKIMTFDTRAKVNRLVIQDVTINSYATGEKSENWDRIKPRFKNLTDDLIADYELKLKKPTTLARLFEFDLEYSLVSKTDLDSILRPHKDADQLEAWKAFYKRYPDSGGYNSFSNVGFNKESDRALVYFVNWCGPLCGTGHYLIVEKQRGKWRVLEKNMIWIS